MNVGEQHNYENAAQEGIEPFLQWPDTVANDHILKVMRDNEKLLKQMSTPEFRAQQMFEAHVKATKINDALKEIIGEESPTLEDIYGNEYLKLLSQYEVTPGEDVPPSREVKIVAPPGTWMASISGLVYSSKTCEQVFEPILADFRNEYFEELRNSATPAKLRFIQIRHWMAFIVAIAHQAVSSAASVIQAFKSAG